MQLLQHYFESQADKHPDRVALVCHGTILTYKEIEDRSNKMAHWLRAKGIAEGEVVGLLLERSVDLYIAIIAILKAGATYVPIDTTCPQIRIEYILSNSQTKVLLTSKHFIEKVANISCSMITLESQEDNIESQTSQRLMLATKPSDRSYIIYTSGTTGWPKGVQIAHSSVCNYVEAALQIYGITADDKVYQGFSIAFDGSIEEMWLALASGATLVVGAHDAIHGGAGLGEFFAQHQITVFSTVPTMLSLIGENLPTLRALILGGEVCSQDLIKHWARPGLRIFNTYGPTETTIIATYHECDPNKPVVIGKPIANCEVIILNDQLQPVPAGEHGELCIGGAGLALSYIGDDELTQKKFIPHPTKPRQHVYRTGDIAYLTEDNDIQFVERMDDQIKLRGFRIELSELESALRQHTGIRSAAVNVCELMPGVQSLVAYVVLKGGATLHQEEVMQYMHSRYPDFMVPTLYEVIPTLPLLPSGKVDRKKLPAPKTHLDQVRPDYLAPRSQIEKRITEVWEMIFKHNPISIKDNFFLNLGGHSLLAAKTISMLRQNPSMKHLSTLDIYECPTIELLAERVNDEYLDEVENESDESLLNGNGLHHRLRYYLCSIMQLFGIYLQVAISSWHFLVIFLSITWAIQTSSLFSIKLLSVLAILLLFLQPALFGVVILLKWLIIGHVKAGKYKVWGWYYFRWWLVQQLKGLVPTGYLVGSPLILTYFRLMGANIGKHCHISSDLINSFDLLSIDDDSSIGADAIVEGYIVENGWLKIGRTTIGKRCYVGANSVLGINTIMGDDAKLGEHSALAENMTLAANQSYAGSPARPSEVIVPTVNGTTSHLANPFHLFAAYHAALMLITFVYGLSILPAVALLDYYGFFHPNLLHFAWVIPLGAIAYIVILLGSVYLLKNLLVGTVKPGKYSTQSFYYVRKWTVDRLIDMTVDSIQALYATVFAASWFKLLGANIGKRTELSTLTYSFPDLLTIGEECFLADGSMLGTPRVYLGYEQLAPVILGNRVFIGNSAIVPMGAELGENCLIGCLSQPPNLKYVPINTSWLGSPPILLPRREVMGSFAEAETYVPSWKRMIARGCVDFLKIILTPILFFLVLGLEFAAIKYLLEQTDMFTIILTFPLIDLTISLGVIGFITLLKWVLIGRYTTTAKPAWDPYVWVSELITGLYDGVAVPLLFDGLLGTPYLAFFLRLLGAKIGSKVYIDTTYFSEFDLVEIGNDVSLNCEATIQTHLFEDRVMKMASLRIEDACTIGRRSIILYDTVMEKHATLGDLSLLMKGEMLPAYSHWEGIPAQYVGKPSHLSTKVTA